MSREIWKAAPLLLGLLSIGLVVGCPSGPATAPGPFSTPSATKQKESAGDKSGASKSASNNAAKVPNGPKPMLEGWAKPAMALVLSADLQGYMEPCGCSATQSGGLSRRADFFRQMREKGWPFAALDSGNLVKRDNYQNRLKFQVLLSALKDLQYKLIGLGTGELGLERLESGFLVTQSVQMANDGGPAFINDNITFTQFKDAGIIVPTKVLTVGGHKVGVTQIFGKAERTQLFGSNSDPNITVEDPEKTLPKAIAALKKENAEVLVLLAQASREEAMALAKAFPEFQLIVLAGLETGNETPEKIGKTLLIEVGEKGKHVGVVGYYPDQKQAPFRFELVDLDKKRFQDTPKMIDHMRQYQHMLEGANYDAVLKDLPKAPHPSDDHFAGVETCKDCHKKAYAIWKDTKHAHAYQTLITGREGAKFVVPRNHDPECLCCHTTGWEPQQVFPYVSGFYSVEKTPQLKDQQCENCHGPAAGHVKLELAWKANPKTVKEADMQAARKRIKLTAAGAEKNLCYRCHDLENDPNFHFAEYWEQIQHPGKD